MQKISYIIWHYASLIVFIFSCWGMGNCTHKLINYGYKNVTSLESAIVTVLGLGIYICFLQILSISGHLTFVWLAFLLGFGVLAGLMNLQSDFPIWLTNFKHFNIRKSLNESTLLIILFLIALPTILLPLRPPGGWDALMYHLPHAKQWATTGTLTVNEWLRYPWFPFNIELLYSASMVVMGDIMPQILNATAGWLIAFILYKLARQHSNFWVAGISVIIWLLLTRSFFDTADVDIGLTLFIFCASVTFYFWLEKQDNLFWLLVSCFFMGLAAGSKYQALMFLPIFFITLVYKERNWRKLQLAFICFLIPCIYWYARNVMLTGDPFNPVGGKLFGFTDWNLGDFEYQFADLERVKGWPSWLLLPAIISLINSGFKNLLFKRAIFSFCIFSFSIWLIASHYPRYLMPALPLIILLAADGWYWLFSKIINSNDQFKFIGSFIENSQKLKYFLFIIVTILMSVDGLIRASSAWNRIAINSSVREKILLKKDSTNAVLIYTNTNFKGKTYQFGLENKQYYLENETWGDHFGPGRYRDYANLESNKLYEKLKQENFRNLLIHSGNWRTIDTKEGFDCFFSEVYEVIPVKLYVINEKPVC